jgi:hypothetical protein
VTAFPWHALREPLSTRERERLTRQLRGLVAWQRSLRAWPRPGAAPDAQPFVSLYVDGALRGCFGSGEGDPGERVARAFLLAAADARFPAIAARERERVVAQVSYCARPREVTAGALVDELEVGTHGVAIVCDDGRRTAVLPDVASDHGLNARRFVAAARAKIGLGPDASPRGTRYFLFETDAISSRGDGVATIASAARLAAAWLARRIAADGSVSFGVDAQRGSPLAPGAMFHARCATAIEALAASGGGRVSAARAWLAGELARALRGAPVEGWPETPAMVAGTLALAVRAGVDVRAPLRELAGRARDLPSSPWHAAQVVSVLGAEAPAACWRACVRDLDRTPVAPWTALAARARGDGAVRARCEAALVDAVRARGPHVGGVSAAAGPELALTAMVITALRDSPTRAARAAVGRATAFLARWQFAPGRIPASVDPDRALGAFPLSPVHHALRTDVTAHALLALA